jgi:formate dehydrogenase subunit gamma
MLRVLLAALVIGISAPALAQQPASVNPRAASVQEQQLLQQLREVDGRVSIPNQNAGVLIQPAGRDWRSFHQDTMTLIGAVAVLGIIGVLALFYLVRGKIRISAGPSGRTIQRFNGFERFVHWLTASTFIVLGISGLNITFGKTVLLPLIGPEAFTSFSYAMKYAHNFLAFPFMLGVLLMLVIWIADNFPNSTDAKWFAAGGGLIGRDHPPARRFNGGQKLIFWTVVLGGIALSVSGVLLLFPFQFTDIAGMQLANIVHGVVGLVMIGIILAHIYIGSVGMEGAFDAMGSGQVDLNWAKEHHSLWVEEQLAKGRVAAPPRGAQAAE